MCVLPVSWSLVIIFLFLFFFFFSLFPLISFLFLFIYLLTYLLDLFSRRAATSPTPVPAARCSSGWAPRPTGRWSAAGSSPLPPLLLSLLPLFLLPLLLPPAAPPLPPPQPRCYWWQPLCLLSQSARDWWEAPPTLPSSTRLSCSTHSPLFFNPSLLIFSQPRDSAILSIKSCERRVCCVLLFFFFSTLCVSSFHCLRLFIFRATPCVCALLLHVFLPAIGCVASVMTWFLCV